LVLEAIRHEIERFISTDFDTVENARALMVAAGETAQSLFTTFKNPIEIAAAEDERRLFAKFISTIELEECAQIPLLYFCRVLGTAEHKQLHHALGKKWGNWYGGSVDEREKPPNVTLHIAAMDAKDAYESIATALIEHGISRVFELREYGDGFEIDVDHVTFTYNGAEGFWTAGDMSWLVYASHEASITFGGEFLIQPMRVVLPEFEKYIYKGWNIADY
jgi:hypothetical protein